MKAKVILIICIMLSVNLAFSQGISVNPSDCGLTYGYDAAGNRIIRFIVSCTGLESHKTDETSDTTSQQSGHSAKDTLFSEIEVNLYPNPTSGKFTLDFNQPLNFVQVVVINNNGQIMLTVKTAGQQIPIDISSFSAGVYYVKLYTTKKEFAKIVVKK
jgi:hypothetical protein